MLFYLVAKKIDYNVCLVLWHLNDWLHIVTQARPHIYQDAFLFPSDIEYILVIR